MQETWVQFLGQEDSPGEGNGNRLQFSCLENPMNKGTRQAIVHGVTRVRHDLVTEPPSSLRCCLLEVNLIWEVSRFISVKQGADFSRGHCHLSIVIHFLPCCCEFWGMLQLIVYTMRLFLKKTGFGHIIYTVQWKDKSRTLCSKGTKKCH